MDRDDRHPKLSKKVQGRWLVLFLIILVPAGLLFTVLGVWKVLVEGDLGFLVFLLAGPFCLLLVAICLKTFVKWTRGDGDDPKAGRLEDWGD